FQSLARAEFGYAGFFDFNGLAGARVTSGASGTLGNREGSEANQSNRVVVFKRRSYGINKRIKCARGIGLGQVGLGGDVFDELCFIHLRITPELLSARRWHSAVRALVKNFGQYELHVSITQDLF